MNEESDRNTEDYLQRLEAHEMLKAEGIEAYADAVTAVLPIDADKKILIKEGFKALLAGPPQMPFPKIMSNPAPMLDAEFTPPVPHIFEYTAPNGDVTVFDWMCLAARGTHSTRHADDGRVTVWKGDSQIMELRGEPAAKFWEWKTDAIRRFARPMPIIGTVPL